MKERIKYLLRSLWHQFDKSNCPYCQGTKFSLVKRKFIVTRLVECNNCHLLFRLPADSKQFNEEFYQGDYEQSDGITTNLPTDEELIQLRSQNFVNTGKDVSRIIEILTLLFTGSDGVRILDYGASWGYMSYQLIQNGLNVQSYEISKPRANFGNKKLGLQIKTSIQDVNPTNQVFFSSHVIEHVPSIPEMIRHAKELTIDSDDVYFIAYCPNGSFDRLKNKPKQYHQNWGLVHPNYISDRFLQSIFSDCPYFIESDPFSFTALQNWNRMSQYTGSMKGDELLVIARLKKVH